MKKIISLLLLIFFPMLLSAEENTCDYSKQVALQSLAVHVNYSYEYSESNKTFSIIFNNVVSDILLVASNVDMNYNENRQVVIKNLASGKTLTVYVKGSSSSGCSNISLRTIRINVPYENPFYNTDQCKEYKELSVCKSRFLDYKLTSTIFGRTIQNYKNQKNNQTTVEEETVFKNIITFFKNYWIETTLVFLGTVPTIIIGSIKLRKARHGF